MGLIRPLITRLGKVVVKGQGRGESAFPHYLEGEAIDPSPAFVLVTVIQIQGPIEAFGGELHDGRFVGVEEIVQDLTGFLSGKPGQGVANFQKHGIGGDKGMILIALGERQRTGMVLVVFVNQGNDIPRINEQRFTHSSRPSNRRRCFPRNPPARKF